jgi:hypothetical protein
MFAEGHSSALLPARKSTACVMNPNEDDDWLNFYVQCLKKPVKCFVLFDCLRNISRTRKDKSI